MAKAVKTEGKAEGKAKAGKAKKAPPTIEQIRLGKRLKVLRAALALSQDQVVAKLTISQKYLSELERGRKTPSWATLLELAHDGFNVRLSALLFGIDEEVGNDARSVEELLAGRPPEVRRAILRAIHDLLAATDAAAAAAVAAASDVVS